MRKWILLLMQKGMSSNLDTTTTTTAAARIVATDRAVMFGERWEQFIDLVLVTAVVVVVVSCLGFITGLAVAFICCRR